MKFKEYLAAYNVDLSKARAIIVKGLIDVITGITEADNNEAASRASISAALDQLVAKVDALYEKHGLIFDPATGKAISTLPQSSTKTVRPRNKRKKP